MPLVLDCIAYPRSLRERDLHARHASSALRTWDERRVIAPVATFIGSSFENWTKEEPSLMITVNLEFDNRADVDSLRKAFDEFVEDEDDIIDREDAKVQVIDQNAKAKIVRFMARAPEPKTGWNMHCRLREHMLAKASELEAANEPMPAYFSREREVRLDVPMEGEED